MTRHAREAISLAVATAIGETALQLLMTTDWSQVGRLAFSFVFLLGPPLFLAVLAWRRRNHPARSRLLFGTAAAVAVGGLCVMGFDFYRFSTDAQFRKSPGMNGLLVPLGQWAVILVVWLYLVVQEGREKRAAEKAGKVEKPAQPVQVQSGTKTTNPTQSA
jgi:hypothetical protein